MAVSALPRVLAGARSSGAIHPLVLLACLVAPALDLLGLVQVESLVALPPLSLGACLAAGVLLVVVWARHVRESWLAAAALAMLASAALRLAMAPGPQAPLLSLLGILALGIGGAFASPAADLDRELSSVNA
jgi:hypothetical protein